MAGHVVFICVANRVRSPFAEFFMKDEMDKRGEDITVSSAGYVPQKLKDRLAEANVAMPEPFFTRSMSELTRATLLEKGISVPNGWCSKELSFEIVEEADLIVTALASQHKDLSSIYKKYRNKFITIRDLSEENNYPFLEDFSAIPLDDTFWHYCEENAEYVSKTLKAWEDILIGAFPSIIRNLRLRGEAKDQVLT